MGGWVWSADARCHGCIQIQLAFLGSDLSQIDMEEADWVTFEPLLFRLVAFDLGQSANPMPLKAAVQGRARQVRDGRLKRIKAVIERQQRVPAEGDDDRLLLDGQHRRSRLLRPSPEIGDAVARLPLANGFLVDLVAPSASSQSPDRNS